MHLTNKTKNRKSTSWCLWRIGNDAGKLKVLSHKCNRETTTKKYVFILLEEVKINMQTQTKAHTWISHFWRAPAACRCLVGVSPTASELNKYGSRCGKTSHSTETGWYSSTGTLTYCCCEGNTYSLIHQDGVSSSRSGCDRAGAGCH